MTIYNALPGRLIAEIDYIFRPGWNTRWTWRPLNAQEHRQKMVKEILSAFDFDCIVETGTCRGSSTAFFLEHFKGPIHTCEVTERFYYYAKKRLRSYPRVSVHLASSPDFLRDFFANNRFQRVFYYLDAHWQDYLPLRDELLAILDENSSGTVVMIDDFQVADDPGYTYDDYGPGKALTLEYLSFLRDKRMYYPALSASEETGAKRGSLVLTVDPSCDEVLQTCKTLRPVP